MNKWLFGFCLLAAGAVIQAEDRPAETLYNQSCIACHQSGVAGAPRRGDANAWKPRLEKGMETLLANTKSGINAMPPKGMCMDCTDTEYKALIEMMANAK